MMMLDDKMRSNRAQRRFNKRSERTAHLIADLPAEVAGPIHEADSRWQDACPKRRGSREEVALHESGHVIACEVEGLGAAEAEIHRVPGTDTCRGWEGSMCPIVRLNTRNHLLRYMSLNVRAEAVAILAGAAAGAMFADVDPLNHAIEVMNAATLAAWLGDIENTSFNVAFADIVVRTVRLLHFNRAHVMMIAARLAHRKHVTRRERKVAATLAAVQEVPPEFLPPVPKEEEMFAQLMARAPINLSAFAQEMNQLTRKYRP